MNEEPAPVNADEIESLATQINGDSALDSPHLQAEEFDALVTEVMDELPQEWAPLLDNMAVVVEDEPLEDDLEAWHGEEGELLGRFRGTGAPVRLLGGGLTGPAVAAPPELALFQGPLERASGSIDDLKQLVYDTLVREIGHYLGIGEDQDGEWDEGTYADEGDDDPEGSEASEQ